MPNKFIKTHKKEFRVSYCGLDHDRADSMVRSQWQTRSKSNWFLVFRWIIAAIAIATVIVSMYQHVQKWSFGLFFIYLTHWGIMLNMIVGVFGAVLVTAWHYHADFQVNVMNTSEMPTSFKIYWALHNIALISSIVITIIYWAILHPKSNIPITTSNVMSHAINSVIMIVDILIVAYPLRLLHVIQPICFGVTFGIFSYIYYICGGVSIKGERFIYHVLDWSKPDKAMITVFGTLVLAFIVHILLFWVYKLRVSIQRHFIGTEMILPTTKSDKQLNRSLGSQISMVFGGNEGCTNNAYKTNTDKTKS